MKENVFRGRLKKNIPGRALRYIGSLDEDKKLVKIDIDVLQAHNIMLHRVGHITEEDLIKVLIGLELTRIKYKTEEFEPDEELIDIHPAIEKIILDLFGIHIGGNTHLAKSRNDQVMTDVRLYVRGEVLEILKELLKLTKLMVDEANTHKETVMPGYTHNQHGQVTTYGYYLLSHVSCFTRYVDRLFETYSRVNMNPLGSGALMGTTLEIDRLYTARLLGFDKVLENTMDAVSNRDFAQEVASILANVMVTISRIAADLISWSSSEYGMVEIADEYCDTSTAMPQKKNPDVLEMMKGYTADVISAANLLAIMEKGETTGYTKALQRTKPPLWMSLHITNESLYLMRKIFETLTVNKSRMTELVKANFAPATDLAEFFVKNNKVSFRESHILTGEIVNELISQEKTFEGLTAELISKISKEAIGKDVILVDDEFKDAVDPLCSILRKTNTDGPSPVNFTKAIDLYKLLINDKEKVLSLKLKKTEEAKLKLNKSVDSLLDTPIAKEIKIKLLMEKEDLLIENKIPLEALGVSK